MKETKKSEEASASKATAIMKAWLERTNADDAQRAILDRLTSLLDEHSKAMKLKLMKCGRLSADIQRVIGNDTGRCLMTDTTVLAEQLIAGKGLEAIILEEQALPQMKLGYARLNFGSSSNPDVIVDSGDLVLFKEWDFERAALAILKTAILSQKKLMAVATKTNMEKFARTVAAPRTETARELLAALADMRRIVESDQALSKDLTKDEIEALRPKPFPLRILSSDAISWLLDAVSAGMIKASELSGLDLIETVSEEPQDVKIPA
jgi:hypothetical protein